MTKKVFERGVALRLAIYASAFVAMFCVASIAVSLRLSPSAVAGDPDGGIIARVDNYRGAPAQYDVIFIGDSRTYCGIHPDLLDPITGKRSVNLSSFSHWFPTQYAEFRRIVGVIPKDAVLVWVIGGQNFARPAPRRSKEYFRFRWRMLRISFRMDFLPPILSTTSPGIRGSHRCGVIGTQSATG